MTELQRTYGGDDGDMNGIDRRHEKMPDDLSKAFERTHDERPEGSRAMGRMAP